MIPPFSIFQDRRELEHFTGEKQYIMIWIILLSLWRGHLIRAVGGRESGQQKVSVLYQSVWEYFGYLEAIEVSREMEDIYPERRFRLLLW